MGGDESFDEFISKSLSLHPEAGAHDCRLGRERGYPVRTLGGGIAIQTKIDDEPISLLPLLLNLAVQHDLRTIPNKITVAITYLITLKFDSLFAANKIPEDDVTQIECVFLDPLPA